MNDDAQVRQEFLERIEAKKVIVHGPFRTKMPGIAEQYRAF